MHLRPRSIGLVVAALAIVAALFLVASRTDPIPVDLATAEIGPLQVTINADGQTRIRDIYEIAAPISGTARRSPVRVGDPVIAGETVVARVEPVAPALLDSRSRLQAEAAVREAEAALHLAETQVVQAEEDASLAETQLARTQRLVNSGVASVTQLEDAEQRSLVRAAALDAARSNLSMAESSLARAQATLIQPGEELAQNPESCCVEITAPIDGVVLEIDVVSERPVTAGTALLSLGQPDDLEIVADLLSSDAVRLSPGARAEVERWGGGAALVARLKRIDPTARTKVSALGIEEQRVDALFELVSPPEAREGLGHGFAVFLRIVEWEADNVLRIPLSALWRQGEGWAVFVVIDGQAIARPVEVGQRGATLAEIQDGLSEGERVVTHPSDDVVTGSPVVDRAALRAK